MPRQEHPPDAPPRAFISYARADGEDAARLLRQRLATEQPAITVWHDRARLEAGVGWWKQITEALDQVELIIMLMTPAAMTSETARKEWRYARQQGVRVCPVRSSALGELDFQRLPTWMRKAQFYDLDREWDTFVAFLKSARRENRVPFMAPDLREDFVKRPREFAALIDVLLDGTDGNPMASTIALKGSGGFGKTTLAIALCHHEDIVVAFDDGVLWATLGQNPNVQQELTKLYAALTGERPAFVDAEDAAIQLAGRLEDRHCLIVIDDVWDPEHARAFLRGGKNCARLITTRRLPVVTDLNATHISVDEMTADQSVQVLVSRLKTTPDDLTPLHALARRLGEWPILLKLVASQIRERVERGDTLKGALDYIHRALDKRGGGVFDSANPVARDKAIETTVGASLDFITAQDRRRCIELSVFPQSRPIPLSALGALWGTDGFETEETTQQLDSAGLIDFDLKTANIRIHDVLQSFLRSKLGDEKAVRARLVHEGWGDRYRLPDAYAWRWIGWHLVQAGEEVELRSRLLDLRWLQTKLVLTNVEALLQDFELARAFDDLRPLRDALRLGSNGLAQDPQQLAGQLWGRLPRGVSPAIDDLLDQTEVGTMAPWLRLSHRSLTRPGGAVIGIFKGHTKSVEALAWSRDGRQAFSGSADWTLRVWDLEAGRAIRVLEGHVGLVSSVALTADERHLVSGSEDRTIRIWNLEQGATETTLRGNYGAITGLALSPNGGWLASVSDDGVARVWDLQTRRQISAIRANSHQLRAITFTRDSRCIVFGSDDWNVVTADVKSATPLKVMVGHEGIVTALVATGDGRCLVSGSADGTLRVWDAETGQTIHTLEGHSAGIDAVAVSVDGRLVVSGSRDATLRLWDLETGEMLRVMEGHSSFVRGLAMNAAGDAIISASGDRTVRHWRPALAPKQRTLTTHPEAVSFLCLAADGHRAVSGSRGGALHIWDVDQGRVLGILGINEGHHDYISSLRVSGDGRIAVTGSRDKTLRVWDLELQVLRRVLAGHTREVRRHELSADGSRMVSLSKDRTLRLWDTGSGRTLRELVSSDNQRRLDTLRAGSALLSELDSEPALSIADTTIGTDGEFALASSGQMVVYGLNGRLTAWDLAIGTTRVKELGDFDIVALAIDPPGKRVIAGSRFGSLYVWDLKDQNTDGALHGHEGAILDVALSTDGRSAVSASSDGTICGWDLDSKRQLGRSPGHARRVDAVAIASDAGLAYFIYGDTVVAWRLFEKIQLGSMSLDHRITALALAPDGRQLALGDESGQVHFVGLNN